MVTKYLSGRSDMILAVAVSFGVGFGLGYLIRDGKYEKITLDEDQPTEPTKREFKLVTVEADVKPIKQPSYLTSKIKAQALIDAEKREQEAIKEVLIEEGTNYYDYDTVRDDHEYPVYPTGQPDPSDIQLSTSWNQEAENANREGKDIYVISRVEFYEEKEDLGWGQEALAYYTTDDILTDENDLPIPNPHKLIGPYKFGQGSDDDNVFYVRNESLQMEYEINAIDGSFLELVMGMELEE